MVGDLSEARATIAALQLSLSAAHGRIRELETTCAAMAERMAAANERADRVEMHLFVMQERARYDGQDRAGATPAFRDVSP